MKKGNLLLAVLVTVCVAADLAMLLNGCASIRPGNDPLIVRAEQTETIAIGAFDLVVNLDNANRPFWRTNIPAFHQFAEWLRAPQVVNQTNTLPRGAAMIWSVNSVKQDYKVNRAQSNLLITAIATLQSAIGQANGWLNLVTNAPVIQLENQH